MIDSGATHFFVSSSLLARSQLQLQPAPNLPVRLADGSVVTSSATCNVPLFIADALHVHVHCRVLDDLSHDLVLGMDFLQAHNPRINWRSYTVTFPASKLLVHCIPT